MATRIGCPDLAAANLEVLVKMVDGRSRSYFNRLGESSPAVTDTDAFATCL